MSSRNRYIRGTVLAVLGSAVFAQPVVAQKIAQQAAQPAAKTVNLKKTKVLGKVKVTAQKREETAQDVPTAISVLGGQDLRDSGIGRGAAEVLSQVPNASAGTQQHGRPRWWIRGVGTGVQSLDTPNPVGVYLDDVYISNASATGFPLFDLDRVEVLRGPQGTLWGKNTTGGAINFVSKKPRFEPDGYLKVDYSPRFNDRILEGAAGGTVRDEQIAGRISFHHETQDGRFDNQTLGTDDGALSDSAFRVQLLNVITPDLEALLNLHARKYVVDGTTSTTTGIGTDGAYLQTGPTATPPNSPIYIPSTSINDVSTNAFAKSDIAQQGAALTFNWQLGRYAFTSITAAEDYEAEGFTDSDNTPLEITRGHTDQQSHQVTQEFRLVSPREDRWNWVAGLHYLNEGIDSASQGGKLYTYAPGQQLNFNNTVYDHKTESYAVFGSSTFAFTEKFDVIAGLRWTTEEKTVDLVRSVAAGTAANGPTPAAPLVYNDPASWWLGNLNKTPTPSVTLDKNKTWSDWTYDLTPQYEITDNVRVYAKYAKGFRSGGYNTGATSQLAVSGDYEVVKPEYLTSVELGVKSEWFDGRLTANATAFQYDYDDIQVNVVGVAPGSQGASVSLLQNVKHGEASGAEFDFEALPLENLHVNLSLGLLNTKFTDFDVQTSATTVVDYSGNRFVRAPKKSAVLGADYDIPVPNGGKIVAGVDLKYQSKQYYFTTNQDNPRLLQDGYTLSNARISYKTADDALIYTAYVNNLSDKKYLNHALPGTQGSKGDVSIWGEPRTFGLSATASW